MIKKIGSAAVADALRAGTPERNVMIYTDSYGCHYSMKRRELKMYTLENYSQSLYETHGTTLKSSAYNYDKIVATVKKYIPEEFLTDYYRNYNNQE